MLINPSKLLTREDINDKLCDLAVPVSVSANWGGYQYLLTKILLEQFCSLFQKVDTSKNNMRQSPTALPLPPPYKGDFFTLTAVVFENFKNR